MKQQQQQHRAGGASATGAGGGNTSSSSPQATTVRSLVDVADSSDEPRFARKGWSSGGRGTLAPQNNRDMLDTLPPSSGDHLELELDVNGAPIDENARAQLRAGDYKQMSQFPSMGGGHFTFGVEKEWNNIAQGQTQAKPSRSYFTLNLSLLSCGLQTIPFYKRMDYPTSMFTRPQIVAQTEAAERAERIYQERVLRELNPNGCVPNENVASPKSRVASAKSTKAEPAVVQSAEPDELDELLAMTNTQLEQTSIANTPSTLPFVGGIAVARPVTATPSSAPKNDVEQWLDSVLDE